MSVQRRIIDGILAALVAVELVAAPARANEADDDYSVAAAHYAAQRWPLAVESFRGLLTKHPDYPKADSANFFLGEALVQLQKYEEALACFRKALQSASDARLKRLAQFRIGEVAYLAGKLDEAKPELAKFLATYPQDDLNGYVLPYLGEIAWAQGDDKAAQGYFDQGLKQFPQGPLQDDCRLGLARLLEKQGHNDEAERYYLALSDKSDSRIAQEALFRLGAVQYTSGKDAQALKTLETFIARYPDSPRKATALLGCGWALVRLDRLADARRYFEQISGDPKVGIEARYWLGWIQKTQGQYAEAADTLLKAADDADAKHPLVTAIRFQAGDALLRCGKSADAMRQFDQAIAAADAKNEWLDDALRGRVQAALMAKDHASVDRCASEFNQRAPDSPLKPEVERLRAQSLLDRKQYKQAQELLAPLVGGADPSEVLQARYLLALAYEGLLRYDDALSTVAPVVASAQGPLKADAQLLQASLLLASKRFAEAVAPLEAVLASKPEGDAAVKALGQLAVCYARTKKLDEAKKVFAQMMEKYAKHPLMAPATEQLAEAAFDAGDKPWANELFSALTAKGRAPEYHSKGLSGLAWTQFKSGQLKEAAASFDKLLQSDPPPALAAEAALVRGRILQQLNQPDAALAMFDLVLNKYAETDRYGEALWAAARLRDDLQQDRQAVDLYRRLIDAFPKFAEMDAVLYRLAWALADSGDADKSLNVFDRLHAEFPQSRYWPDVTFRLAQHAFEAKDYARSESLANAVLAGKPSDSVRENAMYLRGQIAVATEKWPQAREAFEAMVKAFPKSPLRLLADYGIAEALFRQGEYAEAGKLLTQLSQQVDGRREPWMANIPLREAQALCHQKQWNEAYAIASKIEAEYPHYDQQFEVDYVVGRCLANRAEFEKAREAYLRVIRSPQGAKTETAAKAQLMIAESYFHQKNYEAALREFLRLEILYDFPALQAAAVMQAAKCRELLGEPAEAAKLYEHLLSEYPQSEFTADATARLETLKPKMAGRPS